MKNEGFWLGLITGVLIGTYFMLLILSIIGSE